MWYKTLMTGHLQKRRNLYYARLAVPEDLRNHYRRREFIKSLGTADFKVAKAKVLKVISEWKLGFEALRGQPDAITALAAEIRLLDDEQQTNPDAPMSDKDCYIEHVAERIPETREKQFRDIAMKRATPFTLYVDQYFEQWDAQAKTKSMAKTAINRVAKTLPYLERVTRQLVMQLVYADTTSAATKSKNYGFVRQYWKYLQDIGAVPDETRNPFSELSHASKTKIKGIKRTSFTTKEINLLGKTAKEQGDDQLANLVLLAAYTGARIEELCQLKVTSVLRVDGVSCFSIEDAKTEAGNRLVPIHPKLLVLVRRLCKASTDSYLIAGLTESKYGDRSNAIGKRFGRLKTGLGFGEEKVFHSIRKTVTTLLENAGVPEGVAADIVGHEKTTMTYGLYSSGTATKAKYNAVGLLEY